MSFVISLLFLTANRPSNGHFRFFMCLYMCYDLRVFCVNIYAWCCSKLFVADSIPARRSLQISSPTNSPLSILFSARIKFNSLDREKKMKIEN